MTQQCEQIPNVNTSPKMASISTSLANTTSGLHSLQVECNKMLISVMAIIITLLILLVRHGMMYAQLHKGILAGDCGSVSINDVFPDLKQSYAICIMLQKINLVKSG